jgi:hypothetical protein
MAAPAPYVIASRVEEAAEPDRGEAGQGLQVDVRQEVRARDLQACGGRLNTGLAGEQVGPPSQQVAGQDVRHRRTSAEIKRRNGYDRVEIGTPPDQCADGMNEELSLSFGAYLGLLRLREQRLRRAQFDLSGQLIRDARADISERLSTRFDEGLRHVDLAICLYERDVGLCDARRDRQAGGLCVEPGPLRVGSRLGDQGFLSPEEIEIPAEVRLQRSRLLHRPAIRRRDEIAIAEALAEHLPVGIDLRQLASVLHIDDRIGNANACQSALERWIAGEGGIDEPIKLGVSKCFPPLRIDGRRLVGEAQRGRLDGDGMWNAVRNGGAPCEEKCREG